MGHHGPMPLDPWRVLYRDEHAVAVDKPAGIVTESTVDRTRVDLVALVRELLDVRYVGVVHRLDQDTSGVVVFVLEPAATSALSRSFEARRTEKHYLALCRRPDAGTTATEWRVDNHLAALKGTKPTLMGAVHSGGRRAITDFRVLGVAGDVVAVHARPLTGRTHQLRVHLAGGGLPIVGDPLYGSGSSGSEGASRMMLHACRLTIPHPLTSTDVTFEAPAPAELTRFWAARGGDPIPQSCHTPPS